MPAGPAQLVALVPESDTVRSVVLDVREGNGQVDRALDLARRFEQQLPEVGVVLVTDRPEELSLAALRSGVRDLIDPEMGVSDIRWVLRRAQEGATPQQGRAEELYSGRVITIASPKGGVGKTTLATNIARALAEQSPQGTVLVDLDVQFGDVAAALDLDPDYTMGDILGGPTLPDPIALKALLARHPSGLQVVCGVKSPVEADKLTAPRIAELLDMLKREFRYVVVDTAPGLSDQTLAALDHTTDLVVITSLDVPGVRGLHKELEVLDDLHLESATRHLVVNFAERGTGLSIADVEATIGHKVDLVIPRAGSVMRSTNQGVPLVESAPRDKVSKDITELVTRFAPIPTHRAKPSLFGRSR